jgi:methyltransferase (TIGR00027 family)
MVASGEVPAGVGRTAIGMARVRAEESIRPDRLFDDPYAQAFVSAAPGALPDRMTASEDLVSVGAVMSFHGVVRTRFFDDYLLAACAAGARQVVLLAAGLDTRAFRLPWPAGVRLFELDLPDVLAFKEEVLAGRGAPAACQRITLPADLRADWPAELTGAGFDPAEQTAWLAEGLLIYLSSEDAARLLIAVGRLSAPGSRISFEHSVESAGSLLAQTRTIPSLEPFTALWKGGLGERTPGWLTRHGWQVQTRQRSAVAAACGRPVIGPSTGGFLTATRRTIPEEMV